jgi:hypothetical protein
MFIDIIGGVPVAGVYCTLCGTVIPYVTEVNGVNYKEVAAHGGRRRRIRCSQVDQQNAQRLGQPVFKRRRGFESWHGLLLGRPAA